MLKQTIVIGCMFAVGGCGGSIQSDDVPFVNIENADKEMSSGDSLPSNSNTQIMLVDPSEGIESLPISAPGIRDPAVPLPPLEQTVLPDGTVIVNLGNRFLRPLVAVIGCEGEIKPSHDSSALESSDACDENKAGSAVK